MNRWLPRAALVGSALLLAIVSITLQGRSARESAHGSTPSLELPMPAASPGIIPPEAARAELVRRLDEQDSDSPEAARLRAQIQAVRRKASFDYAKAENPGAFRDALAQIKTARDGTTYPPNYRTAQLARAKRMKQAAGVPLPWQERGPGNVSGRARAVVVDPGDPSSNTWLVASVGGGIWKTTNAGISWTDKTPALSSLATTCLAMAASNPDVIYAGTGMGYGRIVDLEGSGVWKSIDRGESWQQLLSTADGQLFAAINRIVVDPNDEDVVVLCSNGQFSHLGTGGGNRSSGIFRSEDGGASWDQTFFPDALLGSSTDNRVQQIIANPLNFNTLYATVNEVGVIKSIDGGKNWTASATDFALPFDIGNPTSGGFGLAGISVRTEIAIAPADTSRLYAAVERPRGVADLYMSQDAGSSWQLITDVSGDPNWFNSFGASGATGSYTAGWFDNTIAVHPYDPDTVFVGGVNLYRLNVNSVSHTRVSTPIGWWIPNAQNIPVVHADHHWLEMIPVDPGTGSFRILNANDGGLAVSDDGGASWRTTTGMVTTQFYGADKKPGLDVYIGGMQDNGTWHSPTGAGPGSSWVPDLGGDGFEVVWNYRDPNLLLGGSQFGNLSRSTDGGQSWFAIPEAKSGPSPFITKIANSKADPDLVFGVGQVGVARSDDFGASWTTHVPTGRWLGYRPFANVEVSNADPQVVWITSRITVDPPSGAAGGIHVSQDGGLSWTEITQNLPGILTESSGLGTDPVDPATAYLCFSVPSTPKIMRTRDFGQSWEDISGFSGPAKTSSNGFPDVAVFSLLVMPFDTDLLWAGTEIGLFISEDGGLSWSFADNGLPHVAVFELSIVDDQVLAATQGRGVWSVTLPQLSGYTPPLATLSPRLHPLVQHPTGNVVIEMDLRSPYDSTQVTVNNLPYVTLPANAAPSTEEILIPVTQARSFSASIIAYKDGRAFTAPGRSVFAIPVEPAEAFESSFDVAGDGGRWTVNGFSVRTWIGFSTKALHSPHLYGAGQDYIATLNTPIVVRGRQATLEYRDVCLVEEGIHPDWQNADFWDYVVVEATADGANWIALLPGYDSRSDPMWSFIYQSGVDLSGDSSSPGDESLFREHSIDLLDHFAAGETIFVRFRLHSDAAAVAWGWAIDDLAIQAVPLSLGDDEPEADPTAVPRVTRLEQNHPNPLNPRTTIEYSVAHHGPVSLVVYNAAGRRVRTLVQESDQDAGQYSVQWNGRDDDGRDVASGVYVYRLLAGPKQLARKMLLVR